ncbi:AMP-dependent synthetase [Bordetella genomosp. 1]|uniref:AMP-dependent synthetase n=1 Tax=Bordetella genomosp. 1 TaxID=1395607 RepID=A0A261RSQ5_9BORD|nr:AMP-binding protein [Bordetella genomosp. 1]MDQ8032657.1 AMP-binding protein [Bordetella sp.]OZI28074.1 AMP-dependent synthetase [Bordetella genomosp. 1]OZI68171.1 AMP-dependent synthetase [Bordetella genomosp. 1]
MSEYFDAQEIRPPEEREAALMRALPDAIAHAQAHAPAIAAQLAGIDPRQITSRQALARLPVLRKHELLERQQARRASDTDGGAVRAFGGYAAVGWGQALRVFASPGPIYEPEGARTDYWRFARALHAAGFRAGELAYNCFSYHFTPAGSMMETAAHAVGCTVFPGGTGQTEQQVRAIADLAPSGYTGTPSFLKIILEKADELGIRLDSLRRALVSGEAFPPSLRDWLAARGIAGYQAYGSADLGMIAFETPAREGLVLGEDLILEIVRPGTGEPVPDGEVGEVVVTTLNPDYPLVRFGTGDLSAIMPGPSPCGRTNVRIRGWMGRADQTTKVRGMFVHPSQVAEVVRRHPEIGRARLVISGSTGSDRMVLRVESATPAAAQDAALAARVAESVRELTKLRADVEWAEPGALPNDGKVIDDVRSYE